MFNSGNGSPTKEIHSHFDAGRVVGVEPPHAARAGSPGPRGHPPASAPAAGLAGPLPHGAASAARARRRGPLGRRPAASHIRRARRGSGLRGGRKRDGNGVSVADLENAEYPLTISFFLFQSNALSKMYKGWL